jgi:hypothetical protein
LKRRLKKVGKVSIEISDDVELKIRRYIAENFWKNPKGKLSEIIEEALKEWLTKKGL